MYVEVLFDWPSDAGSIPAVSTGLDAIGKVAGGVSFLKPAEKLLATIFASAYIKLSRKGNRFGSEAL